MLKKKITLHLLYFNLFKLVEILYLSNDPNNIKNKLGARTLGARSRGSKNVTYIQQTTDKKVNTEPL